MTAAAPGGARPFDLFERALECTPLRLTFFVWLVAFMAWAVFDHPRHAGWSGDYQFFLFLDEVARRSIADFGQLPLWNPYYFGGATLVGNPQTVYLVPTFPLVLLFGVTFGERLSVLTVIVVSCEGGYRLMRHLGARPAAALLVAVAFPLYGRTYGWIRYGQQGLQGMTLAVWVLYGYLKGLERPVYLVLGAAFLTWIVSYRGIQPGPQLALALGFWALLEARRRWLDTRSWRAALWPLGALAALMALGLTLNGLRMVPVLDTVLHHPRVVTETTARTFSHAFVDLYAVPPGTKGDVDFGYAYVGLVTYLCAVLGLLFARVRRRAAIPLLIALAFSLIIFGFSGHFALYPALKQLPLYRSLRNPSLYSFTGAMFVVLAGGLALDELGRWLAARRVAAVRVAAAVVLPLLVLGTAVEVAWRGRVHIQKDTFSSPVPPRVVQEFRQARGSRFAMPMWPFLDRGTLNPYDETAFPATAALRGDLPQEEYLADPGAGQVKRVRWTPNVIDLEVALTRPATLLVNQNFQPGWRASTGRAYARDGLVAVDLPAGTTKLRLRWWPATVTLGLLLMLAAYGGSGWLIWRDRRQRAAARAAGAP